MRKVNVRKFRENLAKELESLPFAVTKHGVVLAYVVSVGAYTGESHVHKKTESKRAVAEPARKKSVDLPGDLRARYKLSHPKETCPRCRVRNEDCRCE